VCACEEDSLEKKRTEIEKNKKYVRFFFSKLPSPHAHTTFPRLPSLLQARAQCSATASQALPASRLLVFQFPFPRLLLFPSPSFLGWQAQHLGSTVRDRANP